MKKREVFTMQKEVEEVLFANSRHSSHCKQLLSKAKADAKEVAKASSQCQSLHHLESFDTSLGESKKKLPYKKGLMIHLIHQFSFCVLLCLALLHPAVNSSERRSVNSSMVHWSSNSNGVQSSTVSTTATVKVINESYSTANSGWMKEEVSGQSDISLPEKSPETFYSSLPSAVTSTSTSVQPSVSAGDLNLKSKSSTLTDALWVPYSKGPLDPSTYQSLHSINSSPASPVYGGEENPSIDDATIIQPLQRDTEAGQKLSHGLQDPSLIPTSQAALFLKSASFFSPPTHWQMDISASTPSSSSPSPLLYSSSSTSLPSSTSPLFSTTATGPLVQYTSTSKSPGRKVASKAVATLDTKEQMSTSTTPKTSTSMSMSSLSSPSPSPVKSPSVKSTHRTTTTTNSGKDHQRSSNNNKNSSSNNKERMRKSDKISQVKVNNSTSKSKQLPSSSTNSPPPQLLSRILESALSSRGKGRSKTRSNGTLSGRSFSSDDEPVLNFNSNGNFSIHNMYYPENVAVYDNLNPQSGPFTRVANDEKLPRYKLVWADEFTDEDVDCKKWMHLVDCSGRGNNEYQCYTDRTDNVFVEEGVLHLQAIVEEYQNRSYTSGRLHSLGSGWLYGLVEVRARLPKGKHLWPAIWMVPVNNIYGPWPRSGEIDIMEMRGQIPSSIESTVHFGASRTDRTYIGSRMIDFHTDFSTQYHIYSFEWTNSTMKWFLDGNQYYHLDLDQEFVTKKGTVVYNKHGSPFDHAYRIILNVAIGGSYFPASVYGNLTTNDAFLWDKPSMEIDWVRVYQRPVQLNSIGETDASKKKSDLNSLQRAPVSLTNDSTNINYNTTANPPIDLAASNSSLGESPFGSPFKPIQGAESNCNSSFCTTTANSTAATGSSVEAGETHEGVSSEPLTSTSTTESVTMSTESQNVPSSTLSPSPSPWPVSERPGASVIEPLVVDSVTLPVKEQQVTSLPREQSHPLAPLPPISLGSLVSSTVPSNDSSDGHIKEQRNRLNSQGKDGRDKISLPDTKADAESVINSNFTSLPPVTQAITDPVTTSTTPGIHSSCTSPSPSSSFSTSTSTSTSSSFSSSSSSSSFSSSSPSSSSTPSPSPSNCTTCSNGDTKLNQEKPNDEKKINEVINYEYDSSEDKMDSPLITYYYYQEDAR